MISFDVVVMTFLIGLILGMVVGLVLSRPTIYH
jgi:hypothetical protein